ncbi:Uncharacterised protein [Listeria grayi]|uniref:Glycosyltransferase subfamily 4-like N-terminal domain-containing protein n=1 Tax=Listeria grayi TaxID=1641 RepID=A0A378MB43_LISGR|nr:glycosyltransferase family 4 protein [Listeria grayi]STY43599.1 Uncharacterised protein [Listeria grayi]
MIRYIRNYRPAVIHANDFDVLLITYLSRYKGARIIYDAHEIYSKNAFINKIKILSHFVQRLEKHIIKHIDHFITVSHAAKGYYQAEHYPKIPVVITNAPIKQLNENRHGKKIRLKSSTKGRSFLTAVTKSLWKQEQCWQMKKLSW